jgi:hypothetical protein
LNFKKIFSRTTGHISIKLVTNHPWVKGIQICSIKGPGPLQRGANHKNVKLGWGHLKNWANFDQTWHKSSLGEGDSSLFKERS